jgi:hypothetical protein
MSSYRKIHSSDLLNADIDIREDWRESLHYTEDGDRAIYSVFQVVLTASSGHRWVAPEVFTGTIALDEDGFPHASSGSAEAQAKAFLAKVRSTPLLALEWEATDPMYGSEAWGPAAEWRMMDDEEQAGYIARYGAPFCESV